MYYFKRKQLCVRESITSQIDKDADTNTIVGTYLVDVIPLLQGVFGKQPHSGSLDLGRPHEQGRTPGQTDVHVLASACISVAVRCGGTPADVGVTLSGCIAARTHLGDGAISGAAAAGKEVLPVVPPHAVLGAEVVVFDAGTAVGFVALSRVVTRIEEGPGDIVGTQPHRRADRSLP